MNNVLPTASQRPFAHRVVMLAITTLMTIGCRSTNPVAPPAPSPPLVFPDQITLRNGSIQLGVSAAVGRVVAFGPLNGPNLIWIADESAVDQPVPGHAVPGQQYINYGGDKLWLAPQPLWARATGNVEWPPDGVIDGEAWNVTQQTPRSLTIESRESPHYGVVVQRTFELHPTLPRVTTTNTVRRIKPNPFPVQAWTVTQVIHPPQVLMDIATPRPIDRPRVQMLTETTADKVKGRVELIDDQSAAVWQIRGDAHAKLGTFGRWIAGVYDDYAFLQTTDFDPDGAYPELSSIQAYYADSYVELEVVGPLIQLAPGESLSNQVIWELIPRDADQTLDALIDQLQSR